MKTLLWSSVASLLFASTMSAQTRSIAERLGHPRDAKMLILHADDLGVAHSENAASFDALLKGGVNSASIMMPTPWVTEVAAFSKANPNADLGLHLVMTSEWETFRWGGLAPNDKTASLHDPDGTMPRQVQTVATRAKVDEVERELRAQIDRAYAIGLKPTHVDSHMGALFSSPGSVRDVREGRALVQAPLPRLHRRAEPGGAVGAAAQRHLPRHRHLRGQRSDKERWNQFYLDV